MKIRSWLWIHFYLPEMKLNHQDLYRLIFSHQDKEELKKFVYHDFVHNFIWLNYYINFAALSFFFCYSKYYELKWLADWIIYLQRLIDIHLNLLKYTLQFEICFHLFYLEEVEWYLNNQFFLIKNIFHNLEFLA